MSLLMDALKKAEQAKAKSDEDQVSASVEPVAEPQTPETDSTIYTNAASDEQATETPESLSLEEIEQTPEAEAEELEFSIENVEALDDAEPVTEEPAAPVEETVDTHIDIIEPGAEKPEQKPTEAAEPVKVSEPEKKPEPVQAQEKPPVAAEPPPVTEAKQAAQPSESVSAPNPVEAEQSPQVSEDKSDKVVPTLIGKRKSHRTYLWVTLIVLLMFTGLGYYFFALMASTQQQGLALVANTDWQSGAMEEEVQAPNPNLEAAAVPEESASVPPANEAPKAVAVVAPTSVEKQLAVPAESVVEKPVAPVKQKKLADTPKRTPVKQLQISRMEKQDPLEITLNKAYRHYQLDELDQAEYYYRIALKSDRNNRDALLGMAVIAQRQGHIDTAGTLYRRLLTLDPKDSVAKTGLMSLPATGSSSQNETQLKLMLGEEPTAAHLHFSLGNEYAARSSWPEAQQAYFNAYRYAPENGDYAFNLAISLEQLGQPQAALTYYQRAQEAAADSVVGFDRQKVAQRIESLSKTINGQ